MASRRAIRATHAVRKARQALSDILGPDEDMIVLHQNEGLPNRYDVEMHGLNPLRRYDRVEWTTARPRPVNRRWAAWITKVDGMRQQFSFATP